MQATEYAGYKWGHYCFGTFSNDNDDIACTVHD